MKRTVASVAQTCFWLSWILLALNCPTAFALLFATSIGLGLVWMSMEDEDGYDETVFGRAHIDFDTVIREGGID